MSEIELQRRNQEQNRETQIWPESEIQRRPQYNQEQIPKIGPAQVKPEDAYYNPDLKLYDISDKLKKILDDNQIPIPVENSKFKHKMPGDKENQYYGELINLQFNKDQIKFFKDIDCLQGIQFQDLNNKDQKHDQQEEDNLNNNDQQHDQQEEDNLNNNDQQKKKKDKGIDIHFFHGQGHQISRYQYYTGQFFFGMWHGKGTLFRFSNIDQIDKDQRYFFGKKFEDLFNLNEKEFNTIVVGNNGGKYYFKEQDQDQGVYQWKDGSKYVGQFQNRKMHGYGIMNFVNGNKYIGQWRQGQMHGCGEYYWKNGDKFVGFYEKGLKHGFGHYVWATGIEYIGMYLDGQQHGDGYLKSKKHRPRFLQWAFNEVQEEKNQLLDSQNSQ